MSVLTRTVLFDAVETDTTIAYNITTTVKTIKLHISGADSYDGTVAFNLKGDEDFDYVAIKGFDYCSLTAVSTLASPTTHNLVFDGLEGDESFQVVLTGRTAGNVTVKLLAIE